MSRVFSSVALNIRSLTAKFLDRLMNLMNCIAALNSFLSALGFKFIYKQISAV